MASSSLWLNESSSASFSLSPSLASWSSSMSSSTTQVADWMYDVFWAELVCFYIAFGISAARVIWILVREPYSGFSVRKGTLILIPFPLLSRALEMSIFWDGYLETSLNKQTLLQTFLGGLPGYLFFSAYSLMFCFWVGLLIPSATVPRVKRATLMVYSAVNVLVYLVWIVLLILMGVEAMDLFHEIEAIYAASLAFVTGMAFGIFGVVVFVHVKNHSVLKSERTSQVLKRVTFPAILFFVVFLLRSGMIIIDMFVLSDNAVGTTISKLLFQPFLDLLPAVLILIVLWKPVVAPKIQSEKTLLKEPRSLNSV
ncbi:hypothetical protein Pelo_4454 [Pelomyxa schiedti]|nr:hypothetical protein Pelo_4454 [Pelomyxa schiedti]